MVLQTENTRKYEPDMNSTIAEDLDNVIFGANQQKQEIYEKALINLLAKTTNTFSFPELKEKNRRFVIWNSLYNIISNTDDDKVLADAFNLVRILSREKESLNELVTDEWLHLIEGHVGLNDYSYSYNRTTLLKMIEAEKALCNILFNSTIAVITCTKIGLLEKIVNRVQYYKIESIDDELKYFDIKLLFLISALCPEVRYKLKEELKLQNYLIDLLKSILAEAAKNSTDTVGLTDMQVNIVCESLKTLFNITLRPGSEEIEEYRKLVHILRNYLLSPVLSIDKTWQLRNDVINLLTNMPSETYDVLLIPVDENKIIPKNLLFEGQNMIVIHEILMFLKAKFNEDTSVSKQNETFSPIITVLLKGASSNRFIRKFLRNHILPPLRDVHSRPEQGTSLRNHLCKMLTTPITQLRDLVAELIFVLCKKSVPRMIKYTGYGNAAGLFAQRGLLGGKRDEGEAEFSSDNQDSETEEYAEFKHGINPVLGCYEKPHPNPMADMSDEQKEYEAMKLVELMDSLMKSGTIKPCRVGADGKPEPLEHVLQLQTGLRDQQIQNQDSDTE